MSDDSIRPGTPEMEKLLVEVRHRFETEPNRPLPERIVEAFMICADETGAADVTKIAEMVGCEPKDVLPIMIEHSEEVR